MKLALTAWRPARYSVVGVVCAIVYNLAMIGGDRIGIHYLPMSILAFAMVAPLGYCLHAAFTFAEPRSLRAFLRFAAGMAAAIPIYLLTMAVLCTGLHLPMVVAAPFATGILFLWNYAAAHWAILGRLFAR